MNFYALIIFCMWCVLGVKAVLSNNVSNIVNENDVIYNRYFEMEKQLKKIVGQGVKSALPYFLEANEHINISSECIKNIFTLTTGLRKLNLWALNFLDATGKISDGFMASNVHFLGDFDQCLKTTVFKKNGELDFRGEYCLIKYKPFIPIPNGPVTMKKGFEEFVNITRNASDILKFIAESANFFYLSEAKFGLCVPSGCSQEDIGQVVKYFGEMVIINASVHSCQIEGSVPVLTKRSIVIICIFSAMGLLGVTGSVIQYYQKEKDNTSKSTITKVLLCFSITSNFPKVISTKTTDQTLSCLHGIRVLTLFWVILSHRYALIGLTVTSRHMLYAVRDWAPQLFAQILMNGYLAVESFFFIGGLLNSYIRTTKEKCQEDGSKKLNIGYIKMILFRLLRLYPAYVFIILLSFLFIPRGPLAVFVQEKYVENCEKYWWRNILFINNFFSYDDVCLEHTWYVSADLQLFLFSLVPVSVIVSKQKKGLILNTALIITGIVITATWTYLKKSPPAVLLHSATKEHILNFQEAYRLPFTHFAPYFSGVLLGYFIAIKHKVKISKIYQIMGWSCAALCFTSMLFILRKWYLYVEYTPLEMALYIAFSKFLYAGSVGWMIFCCAKGYGGIINYILSMKIWVPLSRISYMVYLVSLILQAFYFTNQRTPYEIHEMLVIWRYMGDLSISCLLGLALVVLVECPFIALQKLIFVKEANVLKPSTKSVEQINIDVIKTDGLNPYEMDKNGKVITKF